jgi:hypothetical protein
MGTLRIVVVAAAAVLVLAVLADAAETGTGSQRRAVGGTPQ